ncbi:amidase [Trinickia sp. NRRL B-1857]|uniref:amidase n=1 Tax=Trinickia sp. NRRL B-1857 TaxID=3162879 RepID=UPI003D2BD713
MGQSENIKGTSGDIGVSDIVARMRLGIARPAQCVDDAWAAIARCDVRVRAWAHVPSRGTLLASANRIDPTAALAGVPFGVKDIIDVAGMPTRYGAHLPSTGDAPFDAACVAILRAAGAVPVGKTVTTEFAYRTPGSTRNPHNFERTPGGSSSGSAAAVAAAMVPMALGTQTGGSIIRPAAFCGVVGFKPSIGAVPRDGIKVICESLDTIGWYARSVGDVTEVARVLLPSSAGTPPPARAPRIAVILGGYRHTLDDEARHVLDSVVQRLETQGADCFERHVQGELAQLADAHRTIMRYELAASLSPVAHRYEGRLSEALRSCIRDGLATPLSDYLAMLEVRRELTYDWERFAGHADLIVTPSVPGVAPTGLADTGSSAFNVAWSVLGWPCLHLPAAMSAHGMPLGVQLIGPRYRDTDLLATSAWIESALPRID